MRDVRREKRSRVRRYSWSVVIEREELVNGAIVNRARLKTAMHVKRYLGIGLSWPIADKRLRCSSFSTVLGVGNCGLARFNAKAVCLAECVTSLYA